MAMTRTITKTVGCDLGDRYSQLCVLDAGGAVESRVRVATSRAGLSKWFDGVGPFRVVLEVGTHSRWVEQLLEELGHEVIVANARQVRLIHQGQRKNDKLDAEKLARLARVDVELLHPIRHRSEQAHGELRVLRSRDQLVRARTELINHVRGVSKSFGIRIPKCTGTGFVRRAQQTPMPASLLSAVQPVLLALSAINEQLKAYDKTLETMAQSEVQAQPLLTIHGVGPLTALAFVLTLEDPSRFARSRDVGAYLGLVPAQWQTGQRELELRISKAGDTFVRKLLVNCAQRMLGPFGQDSDLRRFGLRLMQRGGKAAKKKAVIAVARKLAVLMHRLWITGEVYRPLRAPALAAATAA
jgi:transposase